MTPTPFFNEADAEAEIRNLGAVFNAEVLSRTRALYREGVHHLPWAGRAGTYNLAYGGHERQQLDLYRADKTEAPVLLFVHGGGFVSGDKRSDDDFYGNVGRYFAAHGFLSITCNYRLAPDAMYPSGKEDIAAVIAWIAKNSASYGGDPQQLFVIGQSAGASHVAAYLFDPQLRGQGTATIRAAALLSGFYRANAGMLPGPRLYFGDDPAEWGVRSPLTHVTADDLPLLLSVAEFDSGQIAEQTLELAIALGAANGRPPRLQWFAGHNHVSTVHGLGLGRDSVGICIREFFLGSQ